MENNGENSEILEVLRLGAEIGCRKEKDSATALHIACISGRHSTVELLLSQIQSSADKRSLLEARDKWHWTPMHEAAARNHSDIMISLIAEGAEVGAVTNEQQSPLHLAANKGCVEAVTTLLIAKADIEVRDKLIRTPLHSAVAARRVSVVKCLLDKGANIEAKAKFLRTPLHIASSEEDVDPDIARYLLDRGADIEARDESGQMPIHIACMSGNDGGGERTAGLLLSKGADIEARTTSGMTPLHLSTYRFGPTMCCCYLIGKGANPTARNNDWKTPLDLTVSLVDRRKRKALRAAEADWALNHFVLDSLQ
ncbi:hypothetical protein MMC31_007485 [Peltigera leucophlebia]|nr:hypothetical protein [Peltigera leucophlebia]